MDADTDGLPIADTDGPVADGPASAQSPYTVAPGVGAGRRRLNPQARQEEILRAATDAFTAAGYDEVSVAVVAAACGSSEPLVYRYFESKAGLYAAVVRRQFDLLGEQQTAALAALPEHSTIRDQVRSIVEVVLDHVATRQAPWASPFFPGTAEPEPLRRLRAAYRSRFVASLTACLRDPGHRRGVVSLTGFLGFLGAVGQDWWERGCPEQDRGPLVEAALGALQGGVGDWGAFGPVSPEGLAPGSLPG